MQRSISSKSTSPVTMFETPEVCASGSTGNPTVAFAQESLIPPHFEAVQNAIPVCAQKRGCLWSFIAEHVPRYVEQRGIWCPGTIKGRQESAEKFAIHDMHGAMLCSWADRLLTMYPNRTSYSDLGGIQALWNLYEQNVFSMATDLIPCTQACGFKPVRMLKFMRAWAQPMMNGSEPAYSWRENGDAPKYFVGDFAGEHCDGEALPGGGCGGSEAYLPKINWDAYKIVELTRWNLLDRCLAQSEFAIGITEDPTMTIQSSSSKPKNHSDPAKGSAYKSARVPSFDISGVLLTMAWRPIPSSMGRRPVPGMEARDWLTSGLDIVSGCLATKYSCTSSNGL
jgi:hypothetical protein